MSNLEGQRQYTPFLDLKTVDVAVIDCVIV